MSRTKTNNSGINVAVWLDWPISAFRLGNESLKYLRTLLGEGAQIKVCRSERSFLRVLPQTTHALVWEFKSSWFSLAKNLKLLATPSAGRELLPKDVPLGVVKWHGRFHGEIISETVIALMLADCRGILAAINFNRKGNLWPRGEVSPFCRRLFGTKAVILGYGAIGKAIGNKLQALGVSFIGISRKNINELDKSLIDADWLILALPGDTGTDDIINKQRIALLPKHAAIVNIGRGNAIDEKALADALRKRKIRAALLDVFKNEPITKKSPLGKDLPGLLRMPHAAAFAPEYLCMFFDELRKNGLL